MEKQVPSGQEVEAPSRERSGAFVRQRSQFRQWVTLDGSAGFAPEAGRYHLYVSLACPWAHRTVIVRKLRGLEESVSLSVVDPIRDEKGWRFSPEEPGCTADPILGARYLSELYLLADPGFSQRITVPVLWDKKTRTVVNNESREILRMFNEGFAELGKTDVNFCPPELKGTIDAALDAIYEPINNGVYRCGFARSQEAYDQAAKELFEALEHWDGVLERQPYACGEHITEADWCLFTTLFRFDPVYHTHFKCNRKRLVDFPHLWRLARELYQQPGVAETCNLDHIVRHYYRTHRKLNPYGIVPIGPQPDWESSIV